MMNVAIELPKEIANSLAGPDEDLSRIALEALTAQGYRDGKLTHAEVSIYCPSIRVGRPTRF